MAGAESVGDIGELESDALRLIRHERHRSPVLEQDVTVMGPIGVDFKVSTSGTDSDFVVKLIDVYPADYPNHNAPPILLAASPPVLAPANKIQMGGYQQLVRGEPFRGKFRRSFVHDRGRTLRRHATRCAGFLGHDPDDLLTFELWSNIFGNPDTIIADWLTYLNGPLNEVRANAARLSLHTGSRVNRPTGWASSPSSPAD